MSSGKTDKCQILQRTVDQVKKCLKNEKKTCKINLLRNVAPKLIKTLRKTAEINSFFQTKYQNKKIVKSLKQRNRKINLPRNDAPKQKKTPAKLY